MINLLSSSQRLGVRIQLEKPKYFQVLIKNLRENNLNESSSYFLLDIFLFTL